MALTVRMVDVFGEQPFTGNPVAVISGAGDLDTNEMQRIVRWFNLSETTFLLPPTTNNADYRVRIFTLDREMPFAGHPTLGTCHAWLESGGTPRSADVIVQECGAGLVELRRGESGHLSFAAPPLIRSGAPSGEDLDAACAFLGISKSDVVDAAWIDNGPGWLGLELSSAAAVLALEPQRAWPSRIDLGVVGAHTVGSEAAFELRAFFSDQFGNVVEDPVTGSLNASVGQWLFAKGAVRGPYVAAQGTRLGRRGRITVERDASGDIWIGGATRTHVDGCFLLR